ncbi:MAG TPA: sigma-70 family RNA polymerase sigma factor [Kineosporiaceae bacterium]|nr:sigma-70 family RNA polymerase sigma factor [Kineosporiaceae bacterium]
MTARPLDAQSAPAGDPAALERLVTATLTDVWRFLAHLVDVQSADDLTQETYLRAWQSLSRFRGDSSLRTWLLAVARHVAADELRLRRRRGAETLVPDAEQPAGPAAGAPAATRRREADVAEEVGVRDLIGRLDPDRREAFVLTQVIGLEYAEAALACGCPVGTIRSRVARAREDLTRMLDAGSRPRRRVRASA